MKISGFTIARNAVKYGYPVEESILSILPICDEFIVNIGDSEDSTLDVVNSIKSPKIKILSEAWDFSAGMDELDKQTDRALQNCSGDWAFYAQADEIIHEKDLARLRKYMHKYLHDKNIEGFRLRWLHFYGSFYRYRIDAGWFQKQDRIIRNNGKIRSYSEAWGFKNKDGRPINTVKLRCFIYHYGWVKKMDYKIANAQEMGGRTKAFVDKIKPEFDFKDLSKFPVYFGTHPVVMREKIIVHLPSQRDWSNIKKNYFWSPLLWFRIRYKTFIRRKKALVK